MRIYKLFSTAIALCVLVSVLVVSCGKQEEAGAAKSPEASAGQSGGAGQSAVKDDDSQKDIVKIAVGSADHSTLVAALKAGDLVNSLANVGPFTVFAPTNAAFDKLPKGTVETLLKPENVGKLRDILQHHVTVGVIEASALKDGQVLGMVDGTQAKISKKGADTYIDQAKIVASVRASNGIVHVVDGVITPPAGK